MYTLETLRRYLVISGTIKNKNRRQFKLMQIGSSYMRNREIVTITNLEFVWTIVFFSDVQFLKGQMPHDRWHRCQSTMKDEGL